jgi:hypothetical protein
MPPRFGQARSAELYARMYRIVAKTRQRDRCTDAVRWCYLEMLSENPPVRPTGTVLYALKSCIAVADPYAERMAVNLVTGINSRTSRRQENREFVKVLRHAQAMSR